MNRILAGERAFQESPGGGGQGGVGWGNPCGGITPPPGLNWLSMVWAVGNGQIGRPAPGVFAATAGEASLEALARPDPPGVARGPAPLSGVPESDAGYRRD